MQLTDSLHRVWNSTRSYFVYTQGNDVIPLFFCDSYSCRTHFFFAEQFLKFHSPNSIRVQPEL